MSLKKALLYSIIGFIFTIIILFQLGIIGVLLYIIIGFIAVAFLILKLRKIYSNKVIVICIVSYIVSVFVAQNILLSDLAKPSIVDVSPFLQLDGIFIDDVDGVTEFLENSIEELGGKTLRKDVYNNNYYGAITECIYHYSKEETVRNQYPPPASVEVNISFYGYSKQAENDFNGNRNIGSCFERAKYISISDNVEALLGKSRLYRNVDSFYGYDTERFGYTYVRVGNVILSFDERADWKIVGRTSTEAIDKLCKVLAEWAAQNPTQIHVQ